MLLLNERLINLQLDLLKPVMTTFFRTVYYLCGFDFTAKLADRWMEWETRNLKKSCYKFCCKMERRNAKLGLPYRDFWKESCEEFGWEYERP